MLSLVITHVKGTVEFYSSFSESGPCFAFQHAFFLRMKKKSFCLLDMFLQSHFFCEVINIYGLGECPRRAFPQWARTEGIHQFLMTNQLHPLLLSASFFSSLSCSLRGNLSHPDMPSSGTLRKSRFLWLCWLWDGFRGAFWEPSLGKAALGGRPCLCGAEYILSDCWLAWPLENLAVPFWCAVETGSKCTRKKFCEAAIESKSFD